MNNNSTLILTFIVFQLACFYAKGQTVSLLEKIPLLEEPVSISIDRTDNIYIAGKKGNVYKYNNKGQLLFTYSTQRPGNIKNIEAWSTLNPFIFYEGLQEFSFLSRFMTLIATQKFTSDIFARLATPSSDNNLWVFDDQDYTLKKINLHYFEPEIVTTLSNVVNENFAGKHLKEYQNFLFLSDVNTGIYVFDNLGNYIKLLPFSSASYFNFYKNELYYLNSSTLIFYDLYSSDKRSVEISANQNYLFALVTENFLYFISNNSLDIFVPGP